MLDRLALWLSTYALHSTLLLLSAWWLARAFPAARERLWRLALFGGLVTATLHTGGWWPRLAYLELPGLMSPERESSAMPSDHGAHTTAGSSSVAVVPDPHTARRRTATRAAHAASTESSIEASRPPSAVEPYARRDHAAVATRAAAAGPSAHREPTGHGSSHLAASTVAGAPAPSRWWNLAAILWLIAVSVSIAALTYRSARFHLRFVARRRSAHGDMQRLLDDLARRADFRKPVRLTMADSARVPMARGWLRPEICLPPALEGRLQSEELEAALAHELAHLERRDPLWRTVTRLIASALPFQPLNRLACSALEDEAELRCDDRAAALTGRPAALARCLTRVATWTANDRRLAALPALAANGSNLRRRVLRLLEPPERRATPWWAHALSAAPVIAVLAFTPGLGAAPTEETAAGEAKRPTVKTPGMARNQSDAETSTGRPATAPPVVHRLAVPSFDAIVPPPPAAPPPPEAPAAPLRPSVSAAPEPAIAPEALAAPDAPVAPASPVAIAAPVHPDFEAVPAFVFAMADPATADHGPDPDDAYDQDSDEEAREAEEERLEAIAEDVDRLMEDLDDEIETAMAMAEEAFGQELEAVEVEIEGQVESFEDELERSLEPLEQALEELAGELEEAEENGNQRRAAMLERQMGEIGEAMGDLGGRLGRLVSEAALTGVDEHLRTLAEAQGRTVETYAREQADLGTRLAREIEERQRSGQALDDEEIQALEEEIERIAEEAAPHYEELERQIESLTRELEPTRERMRTLSLELRREVDAWRLRHQELLRELEEDGVTVPSYDEEPAPEDRPGRDAEPDDDPAPDPDAEVVESFA